jgi:nucleotide-binding universal stress UspA family protein
MSQYENAHDDTHLALEELVSTLELATLLPLPAATVDALFSRILLAIDFGSASLGAARWGATHVAPNADAVLMHVMTDQLPCDDAPAASANESLQGVSCAVAGGLGGFADTLDIASSRTVVRVGRPSSCLASVANDAEVSLLVLGRRANANRIRVGEPNVIERAARRTSSPVLVVPEGTTKPPDHIVAAVDESRFAPLVLRVAGRLAQMHGLPLTILHVLSPAVGAYERVIRSAKHLLSHVGPPSATASERATVPAPLASRTARWFMRLGRAHDATRRHSAEIAIGDPVREIVRTAMEHAAPLVVVGLRGADEAPPGSIGSVARELMTRGRMPVLAVNAR